jgi:hypothetical protein
LDSATTKAISGIIVIIIIAGATTLCGSWPRPCFLEVVAEPLTFCSPIPSGLFGLISKEINKKYGRQ